MVVTQTADQSVDSRAAIQRVAADAAADDDVIERIARAGKSSRPREGEVFDVDAEGVGSECRSHRVGSGVGRLGDHISHVVDDVGVVACTADQRIGSGAAVEGVVTFATRDYVIGGVACAGECSRARVGQVFDFGAERIDGERRPDGVRSARRPPRQSHRRCCRYIGVVAGAAHELVRACASVQRVVPPSAHNDIGGRVAHADKVTRAGKGQNFNVGRKSVRTPSSANTVSVPAFDASTTTSDALSTR